MNKGDQIYFQTAQGPKSGCVRAVGKHGATVECDGKHHRVKHHHVLGVKESIDRKFNLIDRGDDGALVEDEDGKRSYVAGGILEAEGYLDKFTSLDSVDDGDLVTRRIEREMHGTRCYQVLNGQLPDGAVYVGESSKRAVRLLGHLDTAGLAAPYEVVARSMVEGDDEKHGVLFAFTPEDDQLQDLVNAVAAFQRKSSLDTEDIMVIGQQVGGMTEAVLSHGVISGHEILIIGERDGFEAQPVYLSADLEHMMKARTLDNSTVLFMKAGPIKNRAGLSLQEVTDKRGVVEKRWKRTSEPVKKERDHKNKPDVELEREKRGSEQGYGTQRMSHGDSVSFQAGDVSGQGEIVASGDDGATVKDSEGREHKVLWHEITGHEQKQGDAGAKKTDIFSDEPMKVIGEQKPIPADNFKASDYFKDHNDPDVTAESILSGFPDELIQEMNTAQDRLKKIEETIATYKHGSVYDKKRRELHKDIIDKIFTLDNVRNATPNDGEKPVAVFLGGRGGSGKSAFTKPKEKNGLGMFDSSKFIVLDADEIKKQLPEYAGWNAHQVHEESSDLIDRIKDKALKLNLNIIVDATLKTTHKAVKSIQGFKDSGYGIEVHYMHLPRHEAAKRAVSRFANGDSEKEKRLVPVDVVLSNVSNEASFDAVRDMADKWSFRDNNVAHGEQPILISESGGKLVKSNAVGAILFMRERSL